MMYKLGCEKSKRVASFYIESGYTELTFPELSNFTIPTREIGSH